MRKFLIGIPLLIVSFVVITQLFYFLPQSGLQKRETCAFCTPSVLERQQYYEGKLVRVLYNYRPMLPGHSLVIPKRHAPRFEDLTADEFAEMREVILKVQKAFEKVYGTSDYLLVMQNGEKAGQTENHAHFHMIPRTEKSVVTKIWLWWAMLMRPIYLSLPPNWDDIEKQRALLQQAISYKSLTQRKPVVILASC